MDFMIRSTSRIDEKAVISRIRQLRCDHAGKRGKALFANMLGISSSTYNYYEQDRMPPASLLCAICELTGADIRWLLTGKTSGSSTVVRPIPKPLADKISALLERDPSVWTSLNAFIELLDEKTTVEKALSDSQLLPETSGEIAAKPATHDIKTAGNGNNADSQKSLSKTTDDPAPDRAPSQPPWLPVLGCTAAGIVHFWSADPQSSGKPLGIVELDQIIAHHRKKQKSLKGDHLQVQAGAVRSTSTAVDLPRLDAWQVKLVQLAEVLPDGVCEFVECSEIYQRFPDAFALRIDGDSMAPRICDGDLVILTPSITSRNGTTAVVQLRDQIGVTCKIIRYSDDKVHLIPANEKFDTKIFDREQIVWALAVLWRIRLQ